MSASRLHRGLLKSSRCLVALGTVALLPMAAHAQQYISNGSFEQTTGLPDTGDKTFYVNTTSQTADAAAVVDWTFSDQKDAIFEYLNNATATNNDGKGYIPGTDNANSLPTSFNDVSTVSGDVLQPGAVQVDPDGGYFLAIDGNVQNNPGASYISQTVTGLTPGQNYTLSFWWGAVQMALRNGATTESFNVSFGDQTQSTPVISNCTHCFSGWMQETMNFVADSTTQVLQFTSMGTPVGQPPMTLLDGVSLTEAAVQDPGDPAIAAVPEPSSWLLLLSGFTAMGVRAIRQRRRVDAAGKC